MAVKTYSSAVDNFELVVGNFAITKVFPNSDIEFSADINNKIYICVNAGGLNIKNNSVKNSGVENLYKNFYQLSENEIITLDKYNLRFNIKNINTEENKSLREIILSKFSVNNNAAQDLNKIGASNSEKFNSDNCRVVYFYPKANEIIKSENPYGIVVFNSKMDIKSVEKSIFEISDGFKKIIESLENLRFMGYVTLEWTNDNSILTITPLKEKLVTGRKYSLKLTTNNGKSIDGNMLNLEVFEGAIIYDK